MNACCLIWCDTIADASFGSVCIQAQMLNSSKSWTSCNTPQLKEDLHAALCWDKMGLSSVGVYLLGNIHPDIISPLDWITDKLKENSR